MLTANKVSNDSSYYREMLEQKYAPLLEERLNYRQLVTYVPNKGEPIHRWFAYKEGFSHQLVKSLLDELKAVPGQSRVFDPFCGSGATLLASAEKGFRVTGLDILPVATFVTKVKLRAAREYNLPQLQQVIERLVNSPFTAPTISLPSDVKIIGMAYDKQTLEEILFFQEQIQAEPDLHIRDFLMLGLLAILGSVSYTSKDGQYLRLVEKPKAASVRAALRQQLEMMYSDLHPALGQFTMFTESVDKLEERIWIEQGDARKLASFFNESFDIVITSPPYLNRYDYSRIYTLELCLNWVNNFSDLRQIRHSLLRSHIESKEAPTDNVNHSALLEILANLKQKELNNARIPTMIKGYFEDMNTVIEQLFQVCNPGARIALVVGNARFAGELIPVDLLLSELAQAVGFRVDKIVVTRYKGNSSQQMGKYGRVPVRESILFWTKSDTEVGDEPMPKTQLLVDAMKVDYGLRSTFFYRKLHELGFIEFAQEVEKLVSISSTYNWDEYEQWGISSSAWNYVNQSDLNVMRVFAHPRVLIEQSRLIAYYRSVAALPQKAVKYLALSSLENFETGQNKKPLPHPEAIRLCNLLNTHISAIIDSSLLTFSRQDLNALLYASAGSQINGSWLNAIGVEAEMVIRRLLITEFARQSKIISFLDKNSVSVNNIPHEELIEKISSFRGFRLSDQTSILFGSEPDISLLGKDGRTLAAIEVKGGKDPAGALERYGAAKKSFEQAVRHNPNVKTIFIVSCITDEVQKRLENDPLFQHIFDLTELISSEEKRKAFLDLTQEVLKN